jgi:hypothetical protein
MIVGEAMEGVGVVSRETTGGDGFPQWVKHKGTRQIVVVNIRRSRRNIGCLRDEITKFINIAD